MKDRDILRSLAEQYIEICSENVQNERRNLWRQHNSLKATRPLIYTRPFAWNELRETPSMAMYHDYMNTYHISYAAFGNEDDLSEDYVRARRYIPQLDDVEEGLGKGLENTDLEPDYFNTGLFAPGVLHHFCIIKKGQELFMKISNDEKTSYFHWNNSKAPAINHGRIGIRHMFTRSAIYKDFKISVPE